MTSEVRQAGQVQEDGRRLTVGLGWQAMPGGSVEPDVDLSACLLSEGGRIPGEQFFVFYNNPESPDGSCRLSEDGRTGASKEGEDVETLSVDVTRLDARVTSLVLAVSGRWLALRGDGAAPSAGSPEHRGQVLLSDVGRRQSKEEDKGQTRHGKKTACLSVAGCVGVDDG